MAKTVLEGRGGRVEIEPDGPTVILGERCNALGYRAVREAVAAGRWEEVVARAVAQEKAGAGILNVNMSGMGIPERDCLPEAVRRIGQAVGLPLSLDSGDPEALDAALRVAPGRSLINSVNGEEGRMEPLFALAKAHDAALVALLCEDGGIPKTPEGRLQVARRIVDRASAHGIPVDDLIFDPVCIGVATDPGAGPVLFETCRALRKEFGANLTLGASNVSTQLPRRRTMDAVVLAMAIGAGVNVPITDPTQPALRWTVLAADGCMGRDEYCIRYIRAFRAEEARPKT